ncbi:MAG: phosphopantetheinyl transferase (holo-ACP synthase) [Flavobacterium sp.]|jgi:phosphopantetheinyl transferase (holo-ACP synthase)
MIGNDVVDLNLAKKQSNWRRPNYLQKICTSFEIAAVHSAENPDNLVWEIWSRKEAVYKILLQKKIKKGYYPKKIECLNFEEIGIVSYENFTFFTQTKTTDTYIHSIAVENIKDFNLIKKSILNSKVYKLNEIPYLVNNGVKYPYTKSHHGNFEIDLYLNK